MKYLIFVFCVLCFSSCMEKKWQIEKVTDSSSAFRLPVIPDQFTSATEKAEYMAEKYWVNFNFQDTTQIRKPQYMDQLFVNYLNFLSQASPATGLKSIKQMMDKAETDSTMYSCFISLSDNYLGDPNSQIRNEPLYVVVLESVLASEKVSALYKIRYRHRYELAMKNKPGEKATNFQYTLNSGKQGMLYDIKASYVLLFFNNPDCDDCKNVKQRMVLSLILNNLQKNGMLKVLSLYPDKDLTVWHKHYPEAPAMWINAYDKGAVIETKELYDLKAIPTFYLLDKEKRVVLKDAGFEAIEYWLTANSQQPTANS